MKRIDKYILNEVKLPVILGISLFTFIFLIDIIVSMMENIIVRGISLIDTLRMLSFYLPPILSQTIPMGLFLGVMVTFTKFTRNSESIAMSSMGLSLKEIIKPIFKVACATALFIIFLQESIIPKSFEKLQYLGAKIALENPIFQLKDQTFIDELDDFYIYIDKIQNGEDEGRGVLIFQRDEKTRFPIVLISEKAKGEKDSLVLKDANFYKFDENGKMTLKGKFQEKKVPIASYAGTMKLKIKDTEGMGVIELLSKIKSVDKEEKILYLIEINRKLAVPLSTILLGILGVLLANGHHRSGKGTNFALSLGIIFGYIIILNTGVVMAQKGKIPIVLGVWISNVLLTALTYFTYKKKAKVM